jgi:hypothetical protein
MSFNCDPISIDFIPENPIKLNKKKSKISIIKEKSTTMSMEKRGKLYLMDVPEGEIEEKVIAFLLNLLKTVSPDQLTQKVRNTPFLLSRDIGADKGRMLADALQKLGASAEFVPHASVEPSADRARPGEASDISGHSTTSALKYKPFPTQPKLQKYRTRPHCYCIRFFIIFYHLAKLFSFSCQILQSKDSATKNRQVRTR